MRNMRRPGWLAGRGSSEVVAARPPNTSSSCGGCSTNGARKGCGAGDGRASHFSVARIFNSCVFQKDRLAHARIENPCYGRCRRHSRRTPMPDDRHITPTKTGHGGPSREFPVSVFPRPNACTNVQALPLSDSSKIPPLGRSLRPGFCAARDHRFQKRSFPNGSSIRIVQNTAQIHEPGTDRPMTAGTAACEVIG